jgi:enamine deaminase RidA (YjgF/YER057c/UK114 family)
MPDHIMMIEPKWDWERTLPPAPAIRTGNIVFLSGQIAIGPDGNCVGKGDIIAQAERCFENIEDILGRAGGTMQDVVKMVTYFIEPLSPELAQRYWAVRKRFFGDYRPASTGVQVKALYGPEFLIEIEAVAGLQG